MADMEYDLRKVLPLVKRLLLTHFSNRYKHLNEIEKEARRAFKESAASRDLMEVEIKLNPLGAVK